MKALIRLSAVLALVAASLEAAAQQPVVITSTPTSGGATTKD
jgi:hypothetical protein